MEDFGKAILDRSELDVRRNRLMGRRRKQASFRDLKTLEDFDWSFNRSIKRSHIYELGTCKFLEESRDILFVEPPGVGKSHLCQALGMQAIRQGHTVYYYRSIFDVVRDFLREENLGEDEKVLGRYLKPELLIIDDMGMKQLPKRSGEYLFEIIMRRHQNRSTIMTSNRPIEEWGKLLQDGPSATALLDGFMSVAEIISIKGKSCRSKRLGVAAKKKSL